MLIGKQNFYFPSLFFLDFHFEVYSAYFEIISQLDLLYFLPSLPPFLWTFKYTSTWNIQNLSVIYLEEQPSLVPMRNIPSQENLGEHMVWATVNPLALLVINPALNLFASSLSYHYRFLGFTDISECCNLVWDRYRNTVL